MEAVHLGEPGDRAVRVLLVVPLVRGLRGVPKEWKAESITPKTSCNTVTKVDNGIHSRNMNGVRA